MHVCETYFFWTIIKKSLLLRQTSGSNLNNNKIEGESAIVSDRTEMWLKTWYKEVLEAFSLLELIMWTVFEVTLLAVEILN
jgi:hypothetical protein